MAYDNTGRAETARANRARVLAAALESFVTVGYAATTIKGVAQSAHVSQEYVYKGFGGKAGLLKAVYDTVLAGDDEPIPMAVREHSQAIARASSPAAAAEAWADMVVTVGDRIGPLLTAVAAAGSTDHTAAQLVDAMNGERLAGAQLLATHWAERGWLRPPAGPEWHARTLWILNSPQVKELAAAAGGDGVVDYRSWLVRMVASCVLISDEAAVGDDPEAADHVTRS